MKNETSSYYESMPGAKKKCKIKQKQASNEKRRDKTQLTVISHGALSGISLSCPNPSDT